MKSSELGLLESWLERKQNEISEVGVDIVAGQETW